ncbi:MAG: sulfatase [Candidatus Hydrogenedentes bacterium]|nr:sulfatase [Candidatus Hydrogenedentota bacterium]
MDRKDLSRRGFLRLAGAGTAAAALGPGALGAEPAGQRPNVVLIISDDQGYTDYGFMRHDTIQTPHLDRFASESVVFTRGYVTTALCCPSLSTMLTGLYPHQHRITGNDPVVREDRPLWYEAFEQCPRLPAMLGEAGYASFQTGKFWMGHYARAGFTGGMTVKGRHGEAGLDIGRKTMKPLFDFVDSTQESGQPFFLWYAPFMPHTPHTPPERILAKYAGAGANAKYYAMCEWFDETCGQLLGYLDEHGLRGNTMVVYVCDNGWPGEVKGSPYEMGIRTPIMIRWPGRAEPRMDTSHLASNIDLVPTMLTACGLEPTPEMPGVNLLDAAAVDGRTRVFGENFCHDMADVTAPGKSLRTRTCIDGDWKLIAWQNPLPDVHTNNPIRRCEGDFELYNLREDPAETVNLAEARPERVAAMKKLLDDWWQP